MLLPKPQELAELALIPMGSEHGHPRPPTPSSWGRRHRRAHPPVEWLSIVLAEKQAEGWRRMIELRPRNLYLRQQLDTVERQIRTLRHWYIYG
jgi:hypothetical protein